MKTISKVALEKKQEYDNKYREWCIENPGKIMNGLTSKSMGADLASYCDTVEDLEVLHKIYVRKAIQLEGVHGFNFFTTAFIEILNEYNKQ